MWFLSTCRAKLRQFVAPESVPGGYAILSHVWDEREQSFHELRKLEAECKTNGANPRDLASPKIRRCCELAERHGYQWLWADMCCIDKTSSAELSEAINSMFRYYSLADVCYAYLRDVPSDDRLHEPGSAFRRSVWHSRGWTLQELLAPKFVIFLSKDWVPIGSKADLAPLLQEITRIPRDVLTFKQAMVQFSVAQRMSWAAERETTRSEDQAYCLMGIFGINMATLYGEGPRAFRRLQEEIMKHTPDTSLFAWGSCAEEGERDPQLVDFGHGHAHHDLMHLFATSPSAFRDYRDVRFTSPSIRSRTSSRSPESLEPFLGGDLVGSFTFTVTANGVLARIPVIEEGSHTVALLGLSRNGIRLGLLLQRCPLSVDEDYPVYDIGGHLSLRGTRSAFCRLVALGNAFGSLQLLGKPVAAEWRQVYLATQPPHETAIAVPPPVLLTSGLQTPFRILDRHLGELRTRHRLIVESAEPQSLPWTGSPPARITFRFDHRNTVHARHFRNTVIVQLGRCDNASAHSPESSQRQLGGRDLRPHWANVRFEMDPMIAITLAAWENPLWPPDTDSFPSPSHSSFLTPEHDCPGDHICEWDGRRNTFVDGTYMGSMLSERDFDRAITLSFTPCPINPKDALIVNISEPRPEDLTNATVVWIKHRTGQYEYIK
ncbi:HET-domain-containing protein [Ganoderma leucocontextum]|nr:HET-domain-containing protein [Ganoderma leucocontextum]